MSLEAQLWKDLDAIQAKKAELLARTAPLEAKKARFQATAEQSRLKAAEVEKEIAAIVGEPLTGVMAQLCKDEALLARALHGKKRP